MVTRRNQRESARYCLTGVMAAIGLVLTLPVFPVAASQTATGSPAIEIPPIIGERRHGVAEPTLRPAGTIRIASYNLENLFDDHDDPALTGAQDDKHMTKSAEQLVALAAAINAIDADVLLLQEVESLQALLWFRDGWLSDMGYVYAASHDAGDGRGIEQSVLSRFPIKESAVWPRMELGGVHPQNWGRAENFNAGQPIRFARSPLRATIEVPAEWIRDNPFHGEVREDTDAIKPYRFTVFVVHHKSGGPGEYWRLKEVEKVVELAAVFEAEHPGSHIMIAGDLNATPTQAPTRAYLRAGFIDAFADRVPGDPRFVTHASDRVIDYILVNRAMSPRLVRDSKFVLGTIARPRDSDWRRDPAPEGYASDHYPVVVDVVPRR